MGSGGLCTLRPDALAISARRVIVTFGYFGTSTAEGELEARGRAFSGSSISKASKLGYKDRLLIAKGFAEWNRKNGN